MHTFAKLPLIPTPTGGYFGDTEKKYCRKYTERIHKVLTNTKKYGIILVYSKRIVYECLN